MALTYVSGHKKMIEGENQMPKVFVKDIKDIRLGLEPEVVPQAVNVHCIAVHADESRNSEVRLNLRGCVPIEGYVYNNITDRYAVLCCDDINLGLVAVSYKVRMGGVGNWQMFVPMPEAVLKRYMTSDQRRVLAHFKARHRDSGLEVRYEYIQMLSAYPYG